MAGLIRDIASTYKSFNSLNKVKTFGSDVVNNVSKSLGLKDSSYNLDNTFTGNSIDIDSNKKDIRGIKQVFRNKIQTFKYNEDFKCYNDDFYFNTDGKDFKNNIQLIKIYLFQPFHQALLGAVISQLKNKINTKEGLISVGTLYLGLLAPKLIKNIYILEISKNPQAFYESLHYESQNMSLSFNANNSSVSSDENNNVNILKSNFSQLSQINSMFRFGHWLNVYILPCLENKIYNKMFYLENTYAGWNNENKNNQQAENGIGEYISLFAKFIVSPLTFVENGFIKTPYWNPTQGATGRIYLL